MAKHPLRWLATHVNGFSLPVGGVSWTPGVSDAEVVRGLVAFLEDRRVLYNPYEVEMADHCVQSVLSIRQRLTQTLEQGGIATELAAHLRQMRVACRRFLEQTADGGRRGAYNNGLNDPMLNQALGELRGTFGILLAQLVVMYGFDVEDGLASILPPNPDDDTDDYMAGWV
jgi:hypothetical protein